MHINVIFPARSQMQKILMCFVHLLFRGRKICYTKNFFNATVNEKIFINPFLYAPVCALKAMLYRHIFSIWLSLAPKLYLSSFLNAFYAVLRLTVLKLLTWKYLFYCRKFHYALPKILKVFHMYVLLKCEMYEILHHDKYCWAKH